LKVTHVVKKYKDTNKIGKIVGKEWKEPAFHNLNSVNDAGGGGDNQDDQSDDGQAKIIFGFREKVLSETMLQIL
jgi:hypothetical protein